MQKMQRRYRSLKVASALLLLVIASTISASERNGYLSGKATFDGRFDTACSAWGQDGRTELCQVSFYKLIAMPEKYNKKMVSVTGFIIKSFGHFVLFPTRERYEADVQLEGIELVGKLKMDKQLVGKIDDGFYPVIVTGTFDATYLGPDVHRLGAIYDIILIRPVLHIPEK